MSPEIDAMNLAVALEAQKDIDLAFIEFLCVGYDVCTAFEMACRKAGL